MKSDLTGAKSALQKYAAAHDGTLPKKLEVALTASKITLSEGTIIMGYVVATSITPAAFCLSGTSAGGTLYTITSNTVATGGGLCPTDPKKW